MEKFNRSLIHEGVTVPAFTVESCAAEVMSIPPFPINDFDDSFQLYTDVLDMNKHISRYKFGDDDADYCDIRIGNRPFLA